MTDRGTASVEADITIDADPSKVYELITDLPTLASLSPESAGMKWRKGDSAAAGAVFKGTNRNGFRRWTTTCTVTDADPGRVFAFDVRYLGQPIAHWRYDIAADGNGCRVIEKTWDHRARWMAKAGGLATGVTDRDTANDDHMKQTLQRLKEKAEAGAG
jgi:uncharacterized protein YndB with AHSA1/START domain